MNKGDLITSVAEATRLTKRTAERVINAMLKSIADSLKKGEEVRCLGWGAFATAERKATVGRHPRTGEKLPIPARCVIKLRPGKDLTEAIAILTKTKEAEAAAAASKEKIKAEKTSPKVVAKDDKASSVKAKKSKK